jgi:hypothetical protein
VGQQKHDSRSDRAVRLNPTAPVCSNLWNITITMLILGADARHVMVCIRAPLCCCVGLLTLLEQVADSTMMKESWCSWKGHRSGLVFVHMISYATRVYSKPVRISWREAQFQNQLRELGGRHDRTAFLRSSAWGQLSNERHHTLLFSLFPAEEFTCPLWFLPNHFSVINHSALNWASKPSRHSVALLV